jgi:hypothetical protein
MQFDYLHLRFTHRNYSVRESDTALARLLGSIHGGIGLAHQIMRVILPSFAWLQLFQF